MKRFFILLTAIVMAVLNISAEYSIRFKQHPVGEALSQLVKKYPDIRLTFIYDELGAYSTSTSVNAATPVQAVKQIVGLNPISVIQKDGKIFVEALQKGKHMFRGRVVNEYSEPVAYATVMLLNPKDSVTLTYGVTKNSGSFAIPCDKTDVIAKVSSTGYRTLRFPVKDTDLGNITLQTLAVDLDNLTVEGDEAKLFSDKTVYIPGTRQKRAALSGTDLIDHMSIPQLRLNPQTGAVETTTGKSVALYIDNMPASDSDLKGMNINDVKRVEYFEYPRDIRFEGNPYVVNFIMQKYEYGGYVRLFGYEHFIGNSGYFQPNVRFQYKKMTYDLSAIGFYHNNHHYGNETTEIFRLPQTDGSVKDFTRFSESKSAKDQREQYFVTFRATYSSDRVTARNTLATTIDNKPHEDRNGSVTYTPADFPDSEYSSAVNRKIRTLRYNGFYYFTLNESNSLSFTPNYSYTHTEQNTNYRENGFEDVINGAKDNANNISGRLSYSHNFGKSSSMSLYMRENYSSYRTRYTGSASSLERSHSARTSAGATFDLSAGGFYGEAEFGWTWDNLKVNDLKSNQSKPIMNLSLQYAFNNKHKISGSFSYSTFEPSASFKSENIIQSNHLMSYTGNPSLVPMNNYGYDLSYSWIPSRRFSLSLSGSLTDITKRYVYFYEASPTGILRTIRQPLGSYRLGYFGASFSTNFFDRNLRINGGAGVHYDRNGEPYNFTRWPATYYLRVNYYLGDFYFSGNFSSRQDYSDGIMVGNWMEYDCSYSLSAGWGNGKWNLRATANNFAKWNWKSYRSWFKTNHYDYDTTEFGPFDRAYFTLSATYTFNYGKKVRSSNEPGGPDTGSSGILKN